MTRILLPPDRVARWIANFGTRHTGTALVADDGALAGRADDGSSFAIRLPFATPFGGPADVDALLAARELPDDWGVLLVRKGGFAVARLHGETTVASKVGQRHVQGRTKAGGQSQQRFARRRDNQAREAYEAAAEHAVRLLGDLSGPVATGGDHGAVDAVLADPRLRRLRPLERWLAVPDPRRAVLEAAIEEAAAFEVVVDDRADAGPST